MQPWPKLFQNLRSTRETELADEFPMHVVCQWIGNSQPIAAKHYLQVTADHFSKALQQPAVLPRAGSQSDLALSTQAPVLHGDAANCQKVPEGQAPRVGLEQSENSPRRVQVSETAGAKSGAVDRENATNDPELAQVIEAWPTLPPAIREAVLDMLRAAE